MLIPSLITAGILGALYVTRETEPSSSALDAEMNALGQSVATNPATVDPGRLDALANHLRKAGRTTEASTVEAWAIYVRAIKRGVQPALPPGLPNMSVPQLPPAQVPSPSTSSPAPMPAPPAPAPPAPVGIPVALQSRATSLLAMGTAASPFALESLANEIDTMTPGHPLVNQLRAQADANRALMQQPAPQAPVQGMPYPYAYAQHGAVPSPQQVFAPFAPIFRSVHPARNVASPAPAPSASPIYPIAEEPAPRKRVRCTNPAGCTLYRTPGSLYPSGVTIPAMTVAYVEREEGAWVYVRFGTQQGWAPREAFSTDFLPNAPAYVPVQRRATVFR